MLEAGDRDRRKLVVRKAEPLSAVPGIEALAAALILEHEATKLPNGNRLQQR